MAGCPWFSTGQKPCGAWPRKYATAISPATTKATGRVNSPSSRNRPPNVSRIPAMPGSDAIGAVPPPGMIAAGNASSLAVPNCMKRNAATIRSTLSRYGAHVGHFAGMLGAVMIRVSLSVLGVEGDPTPGGQPRASQDQHQSGDGHRSKMLVQHDDAEQDRHERVDIGNDARPARSGLCDELKEYDQPRRRADHAEHRDGPQCGRRDRVWRAYKHGGGECDCRPRPNPSPPAQPGEIGPTAGPHDWGPGRT